MLYKTTSKLRTSNAKGEPLTLDGDVTFDSSQLDPSDLAAFEAVGACVKFDAASASDASDLGGDFAPEPSAELTPAEKRKATLAAKGK
jgi:hypothetical protein